MARKGQFLRRQLAAAIAALPQCAHGIVLQLVAVHAIAPLAQDRHRTTPPRARDRIAGTHLFSARIG